MGIVKKVVVAVFVLWLLAVAVEGGLVILGLQDLEIGDATVAGNRITLPIKLSNRGYLDLGGKLDVIVEDGSGTGVGRGEFRFDLAPGETKTIPLTIEVTGSQFEAGGRTVISGMVRVAKLVELPVPPIEVPNPRIAR